MSPSNLIDGRAIAEQIHADTAKRIAQLQSRGLDPGLAFVRVGEDPASKVYVAMKERTSERLGIRSQVHVLPDSVSEAEVLQLITALNENPAIHGILVQSPLPQGLRSSRVYAAVRPEKDVDGFHPVNMGKLLVGDPTGFAPCTPAGIHELLIRSGIPTDGAEVVILGRGDIVGKPMAAMLCQKSKHANATVTLCHSRTRDLPSHTRRADILIAAMGCAQFVTVSMVKPGAVVIDVGVNRIPDPGQPGGTRLVGDVDFAGVQPVAGRITPNPGGVGPMTIAKLMENTVRAAEQSLGN